jgi:iron complex outermembrane recepter protein
MFPIKQRLRWLGSVAAMWVASATASDAALAQQPDADTFKLGEVTVTARRFTDTPGDTRIDKQEIWRFDTNSLDQVVKLVPGVTASFDGNGRRNERDIFIRGFGRLQVPLSIDGVRIYLPADNRLDFSRFLTPDLAAIQIQKGYVPVSNGPGGLGGSINLVTRKPVGAFESELQIGSLLGRSVDSDGWNGYARVGTRLDRFYAQVSASYLERDGWPLSGDFQPTSIEDGGRRNGSDARDSRINAKIGFQLSDTDEYSLSYTRQQGEKGAPLNVNNNPPVPPNSYWTWPFWDIENIYWLSNTAIGEAGYLKTRLFYNKFENALFAWDNAAYTTQSANGRFQSFYDDDGYGGSVEVGLPLLPRSVTRFSGHFRRDRHTEFNINRPTSTVFRNTEPVQTTREETWSITAENTFDATDSIELRVGASYDRNRILIAEEFTAARGLFQNPTGGSDSVNGQAAVSWRYAADSTLSASLSSRARFPTLFERYSTRFGTAVPNPDLESERATSMELAWQREFNEDTRVAAALFYADVANAIQTVVVATTPTQLTQAQNVGNGENYGLELSGETRLGGQFTVGGNYTWLERRIVDALQPGLRPVGTPTHQGFAYFTWDAPHGFSVTPSVEFASDRWSDVTGGTFRRMGSYTLLNLQSQWCATDQLTLAVGGSNLTDRNYALADGYPEAGRTLFVKLHLTL